MREAKDAIPENSMKLIVAWGKRQALRSYVRRLPFLLLRDYGASSDYSPIQVRKAIERHGLNLAYLDYAIAIFSDPARVAEYRRSLGAHCDYKAMRDEMAAEYFGGNSNVTVSEICTAAACGHDTSGSGHSQDNGGGHSHSYGVG